MFRVTQRYYDIGKTTATIEEITGDEPKVEGTFPDYDQYQEDFATKKEAEKNRKETLAA